MKINQPSHSLDSRIDSVIRLLEQLIALQMCNGGATQREISENLGISVGKVNSLIKGVKPQRENYNGK